MLRRQVLNRPALTSWSALLDYCTAAMACCETEQFRILFLDRKNNLIADEVQQQGTVDHAPVYVREVLKRALELSASAIILVHNHPSGDDAVARRHRDHPQDHRGRRQAVDSGPRSPDHRPWRPCELPRSEAAVKEGNRQ